MSSCSPLLTLGPQSPCLQNSRRERLFKDLAPSLHHQPLASLQISGKWYYIGSAFRNPQYNESARSIQAAFFFFDPKPAEDKINLREYQTM